MSDKVFFDTAGMIALSVEDDAAHFAAIKLFEQFMKNGCVMVTTDFVMSEFVTWLRYRKYPIEEIFKCLHNLYVNNLEVVEVGGARFSDALILMHKYKDQYFSMTDATAFVVMRELKLKEAFTTDKDFVVVGFKKLL